MPKLSKPILVISHANCDDGMGAAWAAWKKFGDSADYWFANYDSEPPEVEDKEVYILDFSYSREVTEMIELKAKSLVVLDHHDTALRTLAGLPYCHLDMTKSGAVLAWEYFHPNKPLGILLYHVQDNDLWKFECSRTEPFIRSLRSYPQTIATWNTLDSGFEHSKDGDDFYDAFVRDGLAISRFFKVQLEQSLKSTAVDIVVNGVKGRAANLPGTFASDAGNIMAKEYGTFGMTYFFMTNGKVKCSLRSIKGSKCNVALICETFGGGGHPNASAFTTTKEKLMELLNANK